MKYYYEVSQESNNMFGWVIKASNGRVVATTPVLYTTKRSADRAVKTLVDELNEGENNV